MIEAVLIDFHRRTYLQVGSQGASVRVIPMDSGNAGMTLRWLRPARQRALGIRVLDYPIKRAYRLFQQHARLHGTHNTRVAKLLHIRRKK